MKFFSFPRQVAKKSILAIFFLSAFAVSTISVGQTLTAKQTPDIEEIETDIQAFQTYFSKRFPNTPFEDFNKGVFGLPQFERLRVNREILETIPPFTHDLPQGVAAWAKSKNNRPSLAECFRKYPDATSFPYFDGDKVLTLEQAINTCHKASSSALIYGTSNLSILAATYRNQSIGIPIHIDLNEPLIRTAFERGKHLYWSRRGQNNYSCASCHVENAGNRLASTVLSPALGQSAVFPIYSPRLVVKLQQFQSNSNKNWLSLHGQYSLCYIRSGAAPLAQQNEDYIALEVYQSVLDSGMPLNSPSFRP